MALPPRSATSPATTRTAAALREDVAWSAEGESAPILGLLRRSAAGDEAAIGRLYELRFDHVFLAAFRATGRGEDFCLDVVQETFLRVMRAGGRVGRIRDEGHADRWLIAVARSVALDLLRVERRRGRRERRAARREAEMGGAASGGDDTVIAALQAELDRLPSDDRELLHLRTSGMTLAAIAEIVGASVGSVHGRLRRLTGVLGRSQEESK